MQGQADLCATVDIAGERFTAWPDRPLVFSIRNPHLERPFMVILGLEQFPKASADDLMVIDQHHSRGLSVDGHQNCPTWL